MFGKQYIIRGMDNVLSLMVPDEIRVNFKFLEFIIDRVFILFAAFSNVTALLEH